MLNRVLGVKYWQASTKQTVALNPAKGLSHLTVKTLNPVATPSSVERNPLAAAPVPKPKAEKKAEKGGGKGEKSRVGKGKSTPKQEQAGQIAEKEVHRFCPKPSWA